MGGEPFTNLWCFQDKASIRIPELQCAESFWGGESVYVMQGDLAQR